MSSFRAKKRRIYRQMGYQIARRPFCKAQTSIAGFYQSMFAGLQAFMKALRAIPIAKG